MMKNMPYDENLEDVVLGTLIHQPEEIAEIKEYIVNEKIFSQERAKRLWRLLLKLYKNNEHIDLVTVSSHISAEDKTFGLTNMYVVDVSTNALLKGTTIVYAKRMHEKYLLRRVVRSMQDIESLARNNNAEVFETLNSAHSLIGKLIELRPDQKFSIEEEVNQAITSITSKEDKLIKTGYLNIDALSGGLTRGEITIVGGRPGHGKSTFLINLLFNFLNNGNKVLLFNRELTNVEVLKKIIALESGTLSYGKVRQGVYDQEEINELERVKQIITKKYGEDKFKMFDNIRDLPKTINEIRKFKPDVILDDYIQLVSPSENVKIQSLERRLQLERIVTDYKWVAKEMNCAIVLASQLNRALETRNNQRPQLSDLAESGSIEQIAENVFFVYYSYKLTNKLAEKNTIMIVASKVRYGESRDVPLNYDGNHVAITGREDERISN
jgi:replicative DNA helicase